MVSIGPPVERDMPIGKAMFSQRAIVRVDPARPISEAPPWQSLYLAHRSRYAMNNPEPMINPAPSQVGLSGSSPKITAPRTVALISSA